MIIRCLPCFTKKNKRSLWCLLLTKINWYKVTYYRVSLLSLKINPTLMWHCALVCTPKQGTTRLILNGIKNHVCLGVVKRHS